MKHIEEKGMDDVSSSNNPIYGRHFPLDPDLIGDILASYLRSDPTEDPFFLPTFRLESLCDRVSGKVLHDGNLLEGVGSLYALCMYLTSTPKIHISDNAVFRSLLVVETCMSEALALIQEEGKLTLTHPSAQFERYTEDKVDLYDSFEYSYNVAKEIIREIMKSVRSAGDKLDARTKHSRKNARGMKDCYQLHSIYFMCAMALSHACGVLMHYDVMFKCPGIAESLLLAFIASPKRPVTNETNAPTTSSGAHGDHMKRQMKTLEKKSDSDRFNQCFELSSKLCFAVIRSLKLDDAKRLFLVKLRIMRSVATPLVDFAQMSSRVLEIELKKERKLTQVQVYGDIDADCVLLAGQRIPLKMKIPPKVDEDEPEMATSTPTPTKNDRENGSLQSRGPIIAKHLKKSIPQFWDVVERLRPVYLCFMRLRQPQIAYFSAKALSAVQRAQLKGKHDHDMTANQRLDIIEAAYHETASNFIPRVCDPADGLFWAGQHMLEYVVSEAKRGRFICQEDEATIATLSKGIHSLQDESTKSTLEMSKGEWREKQDKIKTLANPDAKKKPSTSPQRIATSFAMLADGGTVPDSRAGRDQEKVTVKKDLLDRLRTAEQEAQFERELGNIFSAKSSAKRKGLLDIRLKVVDKRLEFGLGLYEHSTTAGVGQSRSRRKGVTLKAGVIGGKRRNKSKSSHSNADEASDLTLNQSALDTAEIQRFRKNLRGAGVTAQVHPTYTGISPLWSRPEEPKVENPLADFLPPKEVDHDNLFKNITGEMRKEYAKSITKFQVKRKKDQDKQELKMQESKQLELEKLRTFKLGSLRHAMDERRRIEQDSIGIRNALEETYANEEKARKAQERAERRVRDQQNERENERIKDMKKQSDALNAKEERRKKERETMEKIRLVEISDKKETQEIIRRAKEEARMKVLEERQRRKEDAIIKAVEDRNQKLKERRAQFQVELTDTAKVVRHGSFQQLRGGRTAYYKGVRKRDKPYISYEDDEGRTYYVDTIDNHTTYKMPQDAPIISSENLAMEQYELEHGEGSYAVLLADRAWKDQANADGGYYDESGVWVDLQGYYDENYEFVDLSHGYFDDDGEFIEYANGIGTLDFMV